MFLGDLLLFVLILTGVAVVAVFLNRRLLVLLLSSIFVLLVAMRLNISNMYLMGTVLLALPLASYVVGWMGGRGIEVARTVPESAYEGEPVAVSVDVYSPLALFSGFVRISKALPRYVRFVPGSERTTPIPGGTRHEYQVRPERRGEYRLAGCTVTLQDPLGIFNLNRRFPLSSSMVVYPTSLPWDDSQALGQSSGGWLVQTTEQRRGEEDDFYGTREYRIGDDLRRIHWRSSARHGSLVVVERQRGSSGQLWLALDVMAGSERGSDKDPTLERSIKLAVTLLEAALKRGDSVGFIAPSPSGGTLPPAAGEAQRWRILDMLARVKADGSTTLADALMREDLHAGATVVLLTGAPTAQMVDAMARLKTAGVGVVAAPMETAAPTRTPTYPILSETEFVESAEALGAQSLWYRVPVFNAPAA